MAKIASLSSVLIELPHPLGRCSGLIVRYIFLLVAFHLTLLWDCNQSYLYRVRFQTHG